MPKYRTAVAKTFRFAGVAGDFQIKHTHPRFLAGKLPREVDCFRAMRAPFATKKIDIDGFFNPFRTNVIHGDKNQP
jgi:hypothetical protein